MSNGNLSLRRKERFVIVCVKHVPETAETELKFGSTDKAIEKKGLVYGINKWDDCALEEAVRIKAKQGC